MRPRSGLAALVITVLIWGSTFVVTKLALRAWAPLQLSVARFLIAYAVLLLPARRRGYSWRMLRDPVYLRFGLTGVALFFGLQNLGLLWTTAASASFIHAGTPAIIVLVAAALLEERMRRLQYIGVGLAVAGAMLVAGAGGPNGEGAMSILGNALLVGSAVAWAFYTVDGRRLGVDHDPLVITTASIGCGLLILVPLAVAEISWAGSPKWDPIALGAVLYLGVAASAMTLYLWNAALRTVSAGVAASFINLVPLVGAALAVVAGEHLTLQQAAGGVLALGGVWLSSRQGSAPERSSRAADSAAHQAGHQAGE